MCVLLLVLWTWYCGLWVSLSEGSLLCSAGAAVFQGIFEVWSMAALRWPAQLSNFFLSLFFSEMVIKGKCLMPWAESAYTVQLPRAMPYYQVSSTFLFCWPPSDWWHLNITSITLMLAETGNSRHTSAKKRKFLLSISLIFQPVIYYLLRKISYCTYTYSIFNHFKLHSPTSINVWLHFTLQLSAPFIIIL